MREVFKCSIAGCAGDFSREFGDLDGVELRSTLYTINQLCRLRVDGSGADRS